MDSFFDYLKEYDSSLKGDKNIPFVVTPPVFGAFSWVEMYAQEGEVSKLCAEGKKVSYGELEKGKWMPECKLCDADFINSLTIYLKTDIATALNSDNYLLRVFAYMDRRVGKRTIIKIKDDVEKLPDWIKQFYLIRCEAEGL